MKITIEFESVMEHDLYIREQSMKTKALDNDEDKQVFDGNPEDSANLKNEPQGKIEIFTRRRHFSDYELQFITDYYQIKPARWIAKQLRRKPQDISNMLSRMYKKGLPRKIKKNGDIHEE